MEEVTHSFIIAGLKTSDASVLRGNLHGCVAKWCNKRVALREEIEVADTLGAVGAGAGNRWAYCHRGCNGGGCGYDVCAVSPRSCQKVSSHGFV